MILRDKNERSLKNEYVRLKSYPQGSSTETYKKYIQNINTGNDVYYSVLCIIEMLRIKAPECLLTKKEIDIFFNALIKILTHNKIELDTFVKYRIPSILKNGTVLLKMVDLVNKVHVENKEYLRQIIYILFNECEDFELLRKMVCIVLLHIPKDKSYNYVLNNKKIDRIIEEKMDEYDDNLFAQIYINLEKDYHLNMRNIKGTYKLKYVHAAVKKENINNIIYFYYNDRDKRIRQLISNNLTIFKADLVNRFLNDSDEKVRINIIKNIDIEVAVSNRIPVYERVLDINTDVRKSVYAFFDKLYYFIRENRLSKYINYELLNNFNSKTYTRRPHNNTVSFESPFDRVKVTLKQLEEDDIDKSNYDDSINEKSICIEENQYEDYFVDFCLFMFKGCLTSYEEEYVNVLNKYSFKFNFFHTFINRDGVLKYAEINNSRVYKPNYKLLPPDSTVSFFRIFNVKLENDEIINLIEENIEASIFYFTRYDVFPYLDHFVEKIKILDDRTLILRTLDLVKDYLFSREVPEDILKAVCNHGSHTTENLENTPVPAKESLINLKKSEILLYSFYTSDITSIVAKLEDSFEKIFYFVKKVKDSEKIKSMLKRMELGDEEIIEIILASNELYVLGMFVDRILNISLNEYYKNKIRNGKGVLNIYLYFFTTGKIKIKNTDFFINLVHFIACYATNKIKIKPILRNYLSKIPKSTYDEFCTICDSLKLKSLYDKEEQEWNKIMEKDDMLYFICNVVLGFKTFVLVNKEYLFNKFHDVIDENHSLVFKVS